MPDDIPKHGFPGLEAYTPNGTLSMKSPLGEGPFSATWAAPIAGECKYWDQDWRFQKEKWEHTDVQSLTSSFSRENWMPPVKKVPDLGPSQPVSARDVSLRIEEHFSKLPRRNDEQEVDRFAEEGAALLHSSLSHPNASVGTHELLQRAFTSVLEAHDASGGGLWKRLIKGSFAPIDEVLDSLSSALVTSAHDEDKGKLETYTISATVQAVAVRAKNGAAGDGDFYATAKVWERIFGPDEAAAQASQNEYSALPEPD